MKNQLGVLTNFFIENMPFNIGISALSFSAQKHYRCPEAIFTVVSPSTSGDRGTVSIKRNGYQGILCVPLQSWIYVLEDYQQHLPRTLHVGKCPSQ